VTFAATSGSEPASIPTTGMPASAAVWSPAPICAGSTLMTMASTPCVTTSSIRLMTAPTSPAVSMTLTVKPSSAARASKPST
jgi:hypothetical protein